LEILSLNINRSEPERPSPEEVRLQISLLAALGATAIAVAVRFGLDAPLLPEQLAQFIFAVAPIFMVELAVGLLGPFAKHLAFLACLLLYLLFLAAAAHYALRYIEGFSKRAFTSAVVGLSFIIWLITSFLIYPLLREGPLEQNLTQEILYRSLLLLLVYAVYGGTLLFLSRVYRQHSNLDRQSRTWLGRRRVIRGIGYAVLAVGAYDIGRSLFESWFKRSSGRVTQGNGMFPNINGLAHEITPVGEFYTVSKNAFDPEVNQKSWSLKVAGLVNNQLSLSFEDVRALPVVEEYATLECIDNRVGGDLIGNALWRGVRLKVILDHAGVKDGVVDIVFRAADGYRDSIPLSKAVAEGTMLAYEMGGQPLTREHGFPLRLIVPGIFGMKNIKWITSIEAVDFDFKGYWQSRGWDDQAEYKTMSRIDVPDGEVAGPVTIAGIAFAGDREISKVEVSTNGGKTWEPAELKASLSRFSWVLWSKQWQPPGAGEYSVVVRATDGDGEVQTARIAPAAPDGASGHHRVELGVKM
jgi:DMSO/TMAO reductase YedYZ molybdopterin-dependent catalytic subunit